MGPGTNERERTMNQREAKKAAERAKAARRADQESRLFVAACKGPREQYLAVCEQVEAERLADARDGGK
jgi:hypothetical protein